MILGNAQHNGLLDQYHRLKICEAIDRLRHHAQLGLLILQQRFDARKAGEADEGRA